MKKHLFRLLCTVLPLVLLTGCWQAELIEEEPDALPPVVEEEPPPETPRVVLPETFALPYAPSQTLDPVECSDGIQQVVGSLLYEGLFRLDNALEPQPSLCASYTYDPATYRYTFTLREGVAFSDGSSLTAADVRATLERARQSERYRSRLAGVASISGRGDTVTITLTGPNTGFPALLDIPIIKSGTQKNTVPTGTGPYCYAAEGGNAYLTVNPGWWRGGGQPLERIPLVEAADHDTLLYRFSSHDIQLMTADLTGTQSSGTTGKVGCIDAETTVLQYLGCNTARAPLDNLALRRALWNGINRTYVVSAFLSGHGSAAQFPVSPVSRLYPSGLEETGSADTFSAALLQTGYTAERPLTLLVNEENSFKKSIAGFLAESLTNAGLPVEVQVLPWAEYNAALTAGEFDLYYGEVRLTADWNLAPLLATGGALNYSRWSNPQTDALLAAFAAAEDRTAAMNTLCAHLQSQAPILPVCFKSTSVLYQADVLENLTPTAAEPFYNLTSCTIHLREPDAETGE
ncbi:MAG: ABC transporter substrate-binding protein [Oscillibacter sp.]|nr:ABC transporter substrate-binding protein [Oscillibacter sp.]